MIRTILLSILIIACSGKLAAQQKHGFDITHLSGDFFVYTTWQVYDGAPFPSNSMFVVTTRGIVLIDTPWDTTQTNILCDSIEKRFNRKVVFCISTHFHDDRTGALDILKARGVSTWSSKQTREFCMARNEKQATHSFVNDTTFHFGNHLLQTFYPGPGHTTDNIVVWFAKEKILYGGCFIKSTESTGLGNVADANVKEWPQSVRNVSAVFPHPLWVIPGHQQWGDESLLTHTLQLLKAK